MTDPHQPDQERRDEPAPGDWTWQRPEGGEHVYGDEASPPPAPEAESAPATESQPQRPAEPEAPQPEAPPAWQAPPPPQVPVLGPARPPDEHAAAPPPQPDWQPQQDWGQQPPPGQQWHDPQQPQAPQPPAAPWPQDPWAQQPQWGAPPPGQPPQQGYYPPQGWQQPPAPYPPAWGPPAPPRATWQQGIADLDNRLVGAVAMGGVAAFSMACCPPLGILLALGAAIAAFVVPTDAARPDSVSAVARVPLIVTMGFMALIGAAQFLVGLVPALGQSGLL